MAKVKKVSRNITLSKDLHDTIEWLGKEPTENRNFSNMSETLMKEALIARNVEIKTILKKSK